MREGLFDRLSVKTISYVKRMGTQSLFTIFGGREKIGHEMIETRGVSRKKAIFPSPLPVTPRASQSSRIQSSLASKNCK